MTSNMEAEAEMRAKIGLSVIAKTRPEDVKAAGDYKTSEKDSAAR